MVFTSLFYQAIQTKATLCEMLQIWFLSINPGIYNKKSFNQLASCLYLIENIVKLTGLKNHFSENNLTSIRNIIEPCPDISCFSGIKLITSSEIVFQFHRNFRQRQAKARKVRKILIIILHFIRNCSYNLKKILWSITVLVCMCRPNNVTLM